MRQRFKKHIFLPLALLLYFGVMGVIAYPRYQASGKWTEYWVTLGACALTALLLFFILRRREKLRGRFTKKD